MLARVQRLSFRYNLNVPPLSLSVSETFLTALIAEPRTFFMGLVTGRDSIHIPSYRVAVLEEY